MNKMERSAVIARLRACSPPDEINALLDDIIRLETIEQAATEVMLHLGILARTLPLPDQEAEAIARLGRALASGRGKHHPGSPPLFIQKETGP